MLTSLSRQQRERLIGLITTDGLAYYDARIGEQPTELTAGELAGLLRTARSAGLDAGGDELRIAPPGGGEWQVILPEHYAAWLRADESGTEKGGVVVPDKKPEKKKVDKKAGKEKPKK